ncbi:MAG: GAF domain-containing protein [Acidobacteria bacterium]|nr:GAF domain-containing protein [Acidobacteriota bacterium]MCA1627082.1 GAF domain-containing protein [Acidobacteriota bacterium]
MAHSRTFTSYISATGLSLFAGLAGYFGWRFGLVPELLYSANVLPRTESVELLLGPVPVSAIALTASSVILGLTINSLELRRSWRYLLGGIVALCGASVLVSHLFALELLVTPLLFSGCLSLLLVQVNRLWQLDRQLLNTLFDSPLRAADSGPGADQRLMSGLKLLNTFLPLNEAIVFRVDDSNSFEAVARFKGTAQQAPDASRNSMWREGVKLCERAAASAKLVSQIVGEPKQLTVAVPLLHERETAGVLLIRPAAQLDEDDKLLLEAVASQFARNLKRESFAKNSARSKSFSYFSQRGSRRKLDALSVLKAITVEQRCEAKALAHINDGVAIAYLDGTVALTNPALLRFAGLTPESARQLDLIGLLNHFRTGIFDEPEIAVRRVLQTGIDYAGELASDTKDQILSLRISLLRDQQDNVNGTSSHSDPASQPHPASAGGAENRDQETVPTVSDAEPIGIAVYVSDLSQTKEYEKLKSDMISLMSHELRTPLTSINGFAELLTNDNSIPPQAREFVSIIANESQRMSRMINTFLSVTQLQRSDKQEVLKIPLRLDEVVRETIASLQPVAKKKRIRLLEQPAHRIPPVAADKSLITQAVKNLVHNAIKYSPERTTVTVSTALEAETVRVCVEDRGYGIPAEARERVWDKFYRVVREGQEKDEESTGLGLSFVREVVEQHGGQVTLDSTEGRGSKFSFTLPRL